MPTLGEHEILKSPKMLVYIDLSRLSAPADLASVAEGATFGLKREA